MSVLNTLPAPVIQMGLVEKIVEVQQNLPHVQQLVAQTTARESIKEEQSRVAATDGSENSKKVRERDSGQGGQQRDPDGRRQGNPAREEGQDQDSPRTKPWSGHILNIKI